MAVDLVTPRWSDERYKPKDRATLYFDVSGTNITPGDACAAVPYQKGGSHYLDAAMIADAPEISEALTVSSYYRVRVDFEYDAGQDSGGGGNGTPIDTALTMQWIPVSVTELTDLDINNCPLTNSAYDPFEPQPRDFNVAELEVSRMEQSFDISKSMFYTNSINSNSFTVSGGGSAVSVPPGQAKLLFYGPSDAYKPGQSPIRCVYRFRFQPYFAGTDNLPFEWRSSFQWRIKDQGTRAWFQPADTPSDPGRAFRIDTLWDRSGPVSAPVELNGAGKPRLNGYSVAGNTNFLALPYGPVDGAMITTTVPGGGAQASFAKWLIFRRCEARNFAGLNL